MSSKKSTSPEAETSTTFGNISKVLMQTVNDPMLNARLATTNKQYQKTYQDKQKILRTINVVNQHSKHPQVSAKLSTLNKSYRNLISSKTVYSTQNFLEAIYNIRKKYLPKDNVQFWMHVPVKSLNDVISCRFVISFDIQELAISFHLESKKEQIIKRFKDLILPFQTHLKYNFFCCEVEHHQKSFDKVWHLDSTFRFNSFCVKELVANIVETISKEYVDTNAIPTFNMADQDVIRRIREENPYEADRIQRKENAKKRVAQHISKLLKKWVVFSPTPQLPTQYVIYKSNKRKVRVENGNKYIVISKTAIPLKSIPGKYEYV